MSADLGEMFVTFVEFVEFVEFVTVVTFTRLRAKLDSALSYLHWLNSSQQVKAAEDT